jgi:hypothetical protein
MDPVQVSPKAPSGETVVSQTFVLAAVGYGIPLLLVSGGCVVFLWFGYPQLATLGAVGMLVSIRLIYVAVRGGCRIRADHLTIRGFFTTRTIEFGSVVRIVARSTHGLNPHGIAVMGEGSEVPLRGVTMRHRHGLGQRGCESCRSDSRNVEVVARRLGVPLQREDRG